VATRVGGLPEAVRDGETGLLVEPHSPGTLAEAITRFYQDRLEERFRQRIRQLGHNFTWEDLAGTIETVSTELRLPP
jgi:glycosyltransferase involved in cell wall biosynthesis